MHQARGIQRAPSFSDQPTEVYPGPTGKSPWILLVDDNLTLSRVVSSACREFGWVGTAVSIAQAAILMGAYGCPAAAIVDLILPDGFGLELASQLRTSCSEVALAIISGHLGDEQINSAIVLGATPIGKGGGNMLHGIRRFLEAIPALRPQLPLQIERFCSQSELTPKEADVVRAYAAGTARKQLAEQLGISEAALKKRIRSLLQKTSRADLDEVLLAITRSQ